MTDQPDSREVQTFAVNASSRITCNACGSDWHEGHAQVCSRPDLQARVAVLEAALRDVYNQSLGAIPTTSNADGDATLFIIAGFASAALATATGARIDKLETALRAIVEVCANTGSGNAIVAERVIDRCDDLARAALDR